MKKKISIVNSISKEGLPYKTISKRSWLPEDIPGPESEVDMEEKE